MFTARGVEVHQRDTSRPECAAIYTQRLHAEIERANEQNRSEKASSEGDEDADELSEPFGGDLFGSADEYSHEDFPVPPGSEDGDEEDEDDVDSLEGGWEPEVDQMIDADDDQMDIEIDGSNSESSSHPPPAAETRQQAEGRFVRKPIVMGFNDTQGRNAGAPIHTTNSEHEAYQNALPAGASSESNIFAPFASEMEWMIADWAKTRGPSATAFSELLGIKGVHTHPRNHDYDLLIFS